MKKSNWLKEVVASVCVFSTILLMVNCSGNKSDGGGDPMQNKGIGPITSVQLGAIDNAMADKGQELFKKKCSACHKLEAKYVGPALKGVTKRRTPEWIMNQILNPKEMTEKDPIAKELLATFMTQMTFQDVTQDDARAMLEYFRQNE